MLYLFVIVKDILRAATGTFFLITLLLCLFLGAVQTKLLQAQYWTTAIEKSGAYTELLLKIDSLQEESNAVTLSKGLAPIKISGMLTESRIRELVNENVNRALDFLQGNTTTLKFYTPFKEWNIPIEAPKEVGLGELAVMLKMTSAQLKQTTQSLTTMQSVVRAIVLVNWGIAIFTGVLLIMHFLLGKQLKDTAALLLTSGLITAGIGSLGALIGMLLSQDKQLPSWGKAIMQQLFSDFFSFGRNIGLGLMVVGVVGLILSKFVQKKLPATGNWFVSGIKNSIGVALAFGLLLGILFATVYSLGGKINLNVKPTTDNAYTSKQGWSLQIPKDWKSQVNTRGTTFTNNKIFIGVELVERMAVVDGGNYAQLLVKNVSANPQFKGAFMTKPLADEWHGWKRFVFVYDDAKTDPRLPIRAMHWELYPPTGNGYGIYAITAIAHWSASEKTILQIFDTFTLSKQP